MERYECRFDDGEQICSFPTLEEAKDYRDEHSWEYISRYIRIYDWEKSEYV